MLPQQYCLRWKYHHSNLQTMFSQLLERQAFCDVTLACEGRTIKAHKMVLSACSTYFDTILSQYEEKDPILIMKDVKFVDIKCLVEFMYKGEINVEHCHLATLLKTAEELRIKGLAEVSWRDDDACNNESTPSGGGNNGNGNSERSGGLNGIQSVLPHVSAVMDSNSDQESNSKRKRGRPAMDDYDSQSFSQPKIANLGENNIKRDSYSEEVVIPDTEVGDWDEDQQSDSQNEEHSFSDSKTDNNDHYSKSENGHEYARPGSESDTASHSGATPGTSGGAGLSSHNATNNNNTSSSTLPGGVVVKSENLAALESQWPDVIKMNDYLNTGRRPQFWEEPFTKRVMDAIKNKELEMKSAAELLGVSYGTLYGRYRDAYGCLKHPYRVRDFWSDQGPADILAKLQRQEVTLFRAAELLNVTPQTLSNYLISLNSSDPDASASNYSYDMRGEEGDEGDDIDSGDDSNHMLPQSPSIAILETDDNITKTVLPNHPDITIIKKEKKKDPPIIIPPSQNNHPDDENSDQ